MEQSIITFQANEQELVKTGGVDKFASSTVAYVEAHFELGTNWDSFDSVRAMWRFGSEVLATVLAIENGVGVCQVPHELLEKRGELKVNLVGSIVEDEVISDRLTTFPIVALIITKVAMVTSDETEVTPSQFEQFVAIVKDDADRAEDARDDAESAESSASQSAEDADIARINAESAQNSAEIAQGKAEDAQTASEQAQAKAEEAQGKAETAQQAIEDMSATASVDTNTGTPSVAVTKSTVEGHENLDFAFSNLKGNGISSIAKTSTSGLVDTYTITFTDGTTTTFEVRNGEDGSVAPSAIASDYSSSATYAVGDYVWYDGDLYRCVSEISTAEAWTAGHWAEVALADEVSEVNVQVEDLNEAVFNEVESYVERTLTWESGKYWTMSGIESGYGEAYRATTPIAVESGEVIKISTRISTNIAGAIFFNSSTLSQSTFVGYDGYSIPSGSTTRIYVDEPITVPTGAKYVIVQGRYASNVTFGLKTPVISKDSKIADLEVYDTYNSFEVKNLQRRATNAEKRNAFAWGAFDKLYFCFVHHDTNEYLEDYATVFHNKNTPLGAATIPENIDATHLATLQQIVADGGEVLGHYNASPTESSSDELWLSCTRDVKMALEAYGFEVRGLIKANQTASSTNKGEKYCRRYFDYADNALGISTEYNLPQQLMLTYTSLDAFKSRIDALSNANAKGIHIFGFHGGRVDESWITTEAFAEIIDYINAKSNCEISTISTVFDTFGSTTLANRITALENS